MQKQIIYGQVPSKSNSYRSIVVKGINKLVKNNDVRKYEKQFILQCNLYRNLGIQNKFEFYGDIFFRSERSDLDGCLKVILDCLQKANAIKNDNKCVKIYLRKYVDKENPRVEFILKEINGSDSEHR
jgi:Holliday junction resolvase RusA-like endonuclease